MPLTIRRTAQDERKAACKGIIYLGAQKAVTGQMQPQHVYVCVTWYGVITWRGGVYLGGMMPYLPWAALSCPFGRIQRTRAARWHSTTTRATSARRAAARHNTARDDAHEPPTARGRGAVPPGGPGVRRPHRRDPLSPDVHTIPGGESKSYSKMQKTYTPHSPRIRAYCCREWARRRSRRRGSTSPRWNKIEDSATEGERQEPKRGKGFLRFTEREMRK